MPFFLRYKICASFTFIVLYVCITVIILGRFLMLFQLSDKFELYRFDHAFFPSDGDYRVIKEYLYLTTKLPTLCSIAMYFRNTIFPVL